MAEAAFPHGVCPCPCEQEPASLNQESLHECRALESSEKNRDRTKQLVIKWQPFHHRLHRVRHDVDGEHLPAEEIFERINDEDDGRNLENPKRHHGQAVSDEELN